MYYRSKDILKVLAFYFVLLLTAIVINVHTCNGKGPDVMLYFDIPQDISILNEERLHLN